MKKNKPYPKGDIVRGDIPNPQLKFSFKFFDNSDSELCPPSFHQSYTQVLMGKLKEISCLTVREFTTAFSRGLRAHTHDWSATSRPRGFKHLPLELQCSPGWQFQLTSNEHGRVHGILIDHTFYVIWLDKDHKLYP